MERNFERIPWRLLTLLYLNGAASFKDVCNGGNLDYIFKAADDNRISQTMLRNVRNEEQNREGAELGMPQMLKLLFTIECALEYHCLLIKQLRQLNYSEVCVGVKK